MTRWVLCALLIASACKKKNVDTPKDAAPTPDDPAGKEAMSATPPSPLWELAPQDTKFALVMEPGALGTMVQGLERTVRHFASLPNAPKVLAKATKDMAPMGGPSALSHASLSKHIDLSGGFAAFVSERGAVVWAKPAKPGSIEAWVKSFGGDAPCEPHADGTRCLFGSPPALASKNGMKEMAADWPATLVGPVRIAIHGLPRQAGVKAVRAAIDFSPGGHTLRFKTDGHLPFPLGPSKPSPFLKDMDLTNLDGLTLIDAADFWPMLAQKAPMAEAFAGTLAIWTEHGTATINMAMGIKDAKKVRDEVIPALKALAPTAGATIKEQGNALTFSIEGATGNLLVEDTALRASIKASAIPTAKKRKAPLPMTQELGKPWTFLSWGRGPLWSSFTAESAGPLKDIDLQGMPLDLTLGPLFRFREFGFAIGVDASGINGLWTVGTVHAYAPEIREELDPLLLRLASVDIAALDKLRALAAKHPDSSFAHDAASLGGINSIFPVGMMAAVAIPAFVRYVKKSKTSEARQFTKMLYDGARAYYMDPTMGGMTSMEPVTPHFPKGSTDWTPPQGACCKQGSDKCKPNPALWDKSPWRELYFSVDDPHYYSYRYLVAKDGKSFTVQASGDLDCDGEYSLFEMHGDTGLDGDGPPGSAVLRRTNELE